jgi:hypothetical protein
VAQYNYIITPVSSSAINEDLVIDQSINNLVSDFTINSFFSSPKNNLKIEIYSLDGTVQYENFDYRRYAELLNAAGAGKEGASNITLDPAADVIDTGFETGDVNLVYYFLNNPFSQGKTGGQFFIEALSPDRTELRALSQGLTNQEVRDYGVAFRNKIQSSNFFSEFYVNFLEYTALGLNIELEQIDKGTAIVLKLAQPLPAGININSIFTVSEVVSDTVAYNVTAEIIGQQQETIFLKGPNFNVEVSEENNNSTEYFNYNQLFSYPVTSSYYQLYSLFNEKSAQIAIDHTQYSEFIHFSSIEERLRNFKYKLDLIHSYQDSLSLINSGSYQSTGISGSKEYYTTLIEGIVNNFDHYDRYLYYESGSKAWPKSTSTPPYLNQESTTLESTSWFNREIISASNFDASNFDLLINSIPTFIREDGNNEPYLMFIHMVAQHFDNLWIYFKAVADKYDADNRLNFGVSKDIVRSAIESFGIKLDTSTFNNESLFSMFTGETIVTGSELITSQSIILSGSDNYFLQPVPKDDYQKEIYKRIYHNIPLLVKGKGTERGLRALINCYGIPDDILEIKVQGGQRVEDLNYFGPTGATSSSLQRVRIDSTGSIVTGSTLSHYTSVVKQDKKYSDDQNVIEVGFNLAQNADRFADAKLTGSFSIDQYIGDPRLNYSSSYEELNLLASEVFREGVTWDLITDLWEQSNIIWDEDVFFTNDPYAFIRLLKFFDTSLFRLIKQFVPGRSVANTGVIVRSNKLNRSKAKHVQASFTNQQYTGSIEVASISAKHGDTFQSASTDYISEIVVDTGRILRPITDSSPKYNGELSGSQVTVTTGELNPLNTFKKQGQPFLNFDITVLNFSVPLPPICTIIIEGTYLGEAFTISTNNLNCLVQVTHPVTLSTYTSLVYSHNFDNFEYFTISATPFYGTTFDGWYHTSGPASGSLISTSNPISIYYQNDLSGIEARFI